jgi:aldehyde dehydrogenase (NAD+)
MTLPSAESALHLFEIGDKAAGVWIGSRGRPGAGQALTARSPIDGKVIATVGSATAADVDAAAGAAAVAFLAWRQIPAPRRGLLVRAIGEQLRRRKRELAALVTLETGKIVQEALGEVQEMIDICDFAVGLSRQLYGLTIASERPAHRMAEQWHPLGPIGVITAFNFPVAVWAWNAMIALVCGDPVIWKPSEKTPLCAIACQKIVADAWAQAAGEIGAMPDELKNGDGLSCVLIGRGDVGQALAAEARLLLISATGSVRMGRAVAPVVAQRLGRSLLELGGNNAMVLAPSTDRQLALRAIVFAAAGTAGQRCTSLRRLIVHQDIAAEITEKLAEIFARLKVGDPRDSATLVGPLIDEAAWQSMEAALASARSQGAKVHGGQRVSDDVPAGGVYVRPTLVEIEPDAPIVREETFAPILYVMRYATIEQAIAINNGVPQGLASAIFTSDVREAELFCSASGSDCGIVNVNIGTSGAEIGGAFGGEKQTGGGRESGSDAWKSYMRRATNTVNYSTDLPLAQGIKFDV